MTNKTKAKINGITPFVCTIVFLLLGFYKEMWHPGWLVFLLIPIVSSLLYTKTLNIVFSIAILITYLSIGFTSQVWHPTWIMFLLIPIFNIIFPKRKKFNKKREIYMTREIKAKIIGVTPFVSLITFLLIGFSTKIWNPTWLVFLLIPVVPALLNTRRINISYTFFITIVYVIYGLITKSWHPQWVIFLTIPIFYIIFPNKKLVIWQSKAEKERQRKKKDRKVNFEKIKNEFFNQNNNEQSNHDSSSSDDEPEVDVVFENERKK